MCSTKTYSHDVKNHITRDNMWNQHLHWQLLIKKKNIKSKKYRNTGNEAKCQDRRRWTWFILFFFSFFHFDLFFYFLYSEQLGLGLISHIITSVTWWHSHKTDHKTWENLIEDSRTDDVIQYGHHMLAS